MPRTCRLLRLKSVKFANTWSRRITEVGLLSTEASLRQPSLVMPSARSVLPFLRGTK